ncbi:hypothetical protein JTB14_020739 [Gonioctena quinquepunctata]|nr:hypothetical protein JTB14_020739 [Gonioctena quinquepunctata]
MIPSFNPQLSSGTRTNAAINTIQVYSNSQSSSQGTIQNKLNNEIRTTPRTFTSTEAQTDEISVLPSISNEPTSSGAREQRRRERRERRHHRRMNNGNHRNSSDIGTQSTSSCNDRLPDLLNNHQPPPYSTFQNGGPAPIPPPQSVISHMSPLVPNPAIVSPQMLPHGPVMQTVVPNNLVPPSGFVFQAPPPGIPGQVPLVQGPAPPMAVPLPAPSGFRFPFPANGFRR